MAAGEVGAAALCICGYNCILRTEELLTLARNHIQWNESMSAGVIILPWTKSGQRAGCMESVTFNDPIVARILCAACARVGPQSRLFTDSGQRFRALLNWALEACLRLREELASTVACKDAPTCTLDASMVTSLMEVEAIFAHAHRGKAAGIDAIPPEAFAAAPQAMAKIFHPLMVKAALRFEEPLAWKGGVSIKLYKGKGAVLQCKSYRDVLVSDIAGKAYHKTFLGPSGVRHAVWRLRALLTMEGSRKHQ